MNKSTASAPPKALTPVMGILFSLSICHCCNDSLQAVVSSIYPIIKDDLTLNFVQIGLLSLCYQMTASIFQPVFGLYLDRKPNPYFITLAACLTFSGLMLLAFASSFWAIIAAVMVVGLGSSIVHPEASRLTSMASGGRRGLAQSIFQVGGNLGSSIGPLLAAFFVAPYGRENTALVALLSFVGIGVSLIISRWYKRLLQEQKHSVLDKSTPTQTVFASTAQAQPYSNRRTAFYIGVLLILIFSKYVYSASMTSYYTFYTMARFDLDIQQSQYALFVFIFATALGTLGGGPLGDKIGRKNVIWFSILGVSPFTIAMPHLGLTGTLLCSFASGLIIASAFPAIVILAQELLPRRLGMISGLFFGFAFGIAGIAAACWGVYAQYYGIEAIFTLSAYLPLLGIVAIGLPKK